MYPLDIRFDGTMPPEDIERAIRRDDPHFPHTALICLENTVHGAIGTPITPEYTATVGKIAHEHGLQLHLDGARLFNAAAALNVSPRELAAPADSIQLCLSKGLCAPVGSLLVGSREFIGRALRTRKVLGGSMRQVGVIAAAGLVALRDMRGRLAEDHATAQQLADGLATIDGITLLPVHQRTNMVNFTISDSVNVPEFIARLREHNIILRGGPTFRAVTHYWITPERVQVVVDTIREVLTQALPVAEQAKGEASIY